MNSDNVTRPQIGTLIRRVLAAFSLDWIPLVINGIRSLQKLFGQDTRDGLYEMLEHDAVLELADLQGETAILKKRQKVKLLQDCHRLSGSCVGQRRRSGPVSLLSRG